MSNWATVAPAITSAFLASLVEVVEAFTIVLAVASVRGARPAVSGTLAGLVVLALIVLVFGPAVYRIPLWLLQVGVGILLLLFGMRWLRKAVLRAAGVVALHKPLAHVPENALKFGVGVMLSAFGVFWTGEGLGVPWPGEDLAILAFAATFLAVGLSLIAVLRSRSVELAR